MSQCSSKWVKNLLCVLIDKRRERILDYLPDVYKSVAGKIRGIVPVIVSNSNSVDRRQACQIEEKS